LGFTTLRTYTIYAVAAVVGMFAPVFVLWVARTAPVGASPMVVAVSVVLGLAVVSALLASILPRRWIFIAVLVSLPVALLGSAMFFALGGGGDAYRIWLFVGIGSLMSSAIAAVISATAVLRMASRSTPTVERDARQGEARPSE
jgi:hypothetical protein